MPDIDRMRDKSRVHEYKEGLRPHFMTAPLAEKTLEESLIILTEGVEGVSMDVLGPRGRKRRDNILMVKLKGKIPCRVLIYQNTHA